MIYRKLIVIGAHVTVGAPRERGNIYDKYIVLFMKQKKEFKCKYWQSH